MHYQQASAWSFVICPSHTCNLWVGTQFGLQFCFVQGSGGQRYYCVQIKLCTRGVLYCLNLGSSLENRKGLTLNNPVFVHLTCHSCSIPLFLPFYWWCFAIVIGGGNWGSWNHWSLCSKTCDSGWQRRFRMCEGTGVQGYPCDGSGEEVRSCNEKKCPGQ